MNTKMDIAILASWSLIKSSSDFFIPTTHHVYLEYVSGLYQKVYLISPISKETNPKKGKLLRFSNVEVIPLPANKSYFDAIKKIRIYYGALKEVCRKVSFVYCRVPDPFSWMPALVFKKKTVMHFVGDTIDATQRNEKWSWLKKRIMIAGYLPDYWLTLKAARKSRVYTNGHHLAERLARHGIKATPVISSTVFERDLHDDFKPLPIQQGRVVITYIGYVRFAKGMNCLMQFCKQLKEEGIQFHFHLIGGGEMFAEVKAYFENGKLMDCITMHGHVDNRSEMNKVLRSSDLFFFPSLSEGSPRVVIEAMALGTPVMSTPVGALPTTFKDGENIRFFDFNDVKGAVSIVKDYIQNPKAFEEQRKKAYQMVAEQFTIEKFLSKVFHYEA